MNKILIIDPTNGSVREANAADMIAGALGQAGVSNGFSHGVPNLVQLSQQFPMIKGSLSEILKHIPAASTVLEHRLEGPKEDATMGIKIELGIVRKALKATNIPAIIDAKQTDNMLIDLGDAISSKSDFVKSFKAGVSAQVFNEYVAHIMQNANHKIANGGAYTFSQK